VLNPPLCRNVFFYYAQVTLFGLPWILFFSGLDIPRGSRSPPCDPSIAPRHTLTQ